MVHDRPPTHHVRSTFMKPADAKRPKEFRVLVYTLLSIFRRLGKRRLFTYRNPIVARFGGDVARLRRLTLRRLTVIGVTGSCGKTTTTELAGQILSAKSQCHVKSSGNTSLAALRSMLSIDPSARFCVHEVGAHAPGSIARAVGILRPQIGIVTAIGTDHYRKFRSLEAIAAEKAALVAALPRSGTAILNADDPHVLSMVSQTRARIVTFGTSPGADIRATDVSSVWPERLSLTATYDGQRQRIQSRLVGDHWVTSILAAMACGIVCGVNFEDCAEAVEKFEPMFARYSVHTRPGLPVYVLDTRKAPAWTLPYSLAFIGRARAPRKTIVFGTLSDRPGGWTSARYRKLAHEALQVADRVVFVGPNATYVDKIRDGEIADRLFSFLTPYQASELIARDARADELILVKGSISDHLERIMLSAIDHVVCWKQPCARQMDCLDCRLYRTPHPPPLGSGHDASARSPEIAAKTRMVEGA